MNLKQALSLATLKLTSETPKLDAEVLLAYALNKSRSFLYAHPENELSLAQEAKFIELLQSRLNGKPIAYLVGTKEFFGLEFMVNEAVLIPRPDTETLVAAILALHDAKTKLRLIDLGTGSGAIALAVAKERPKWQVTATDICAKALAVAKANSLALGINNVKFFSANWLTDIPCKFDLIVSNPPYIDKHDRHLTKGDVRFEPQSALVAANQGLAAIEIIAAQALEKLNAGGYLLFEHGFDQGENVAKILLSLGYAKILQHQDLSGNVRVTAATR